MTANELADEFLQRLFYSKESAEFQNCGKQVVSMLRQQQAENEALKKQLCPTPKEFLGVTPDGVLMFKEEERNDAEHYKLKCASQQAEIEALKAGMEKLKDAYCERDNTVRQQHSEIEALKKTIDSLFSGLESSVELNKLQATRNKNEPQP